MAGRLRPAPGGWLLALTLCALGCDDAPPSTPEGDAPRADAALDGAALDARPDGTPPRVDAAPDVGPGGPDAMGDAIFDALPDTARDAEPDAARPDPDRGPPGPEPTHFLERGRCFEHTPRCDGVADCDPGLYRACEGGRCIIDAPCGCVGDADCAPGDLCFVNARVCGVCLPAPGRCPDGQCPVGEICVDGFCRDDCPGFDDGPPLDCRGEPPAGACDGRWAYLREAGTCVPVDGVTCADGANAFDSRVDCVERCRGPVACTATLERRVGNTENRRVACPISHGPGACIALAHCVCELGDPPDDPTAARESLRGCAAWMTIPRGAITFADFCGEDSLTAVVGAMRESGFLDAVIGVDTRLELAPGCADVLTSFGTGPMCMDGVENGWEAGVDCGPQGCDACE